MIFDIDLCFFFFFFSSRRRHTRWTGDWSSDVCSSDLLKALEDLLEGTSAGDALAAAATEVPFESLQPIADVRGGEAWKRRVVTNLVRQTVADAVGKGG